MTATQQDTYDVVVVGGGPGGYAAALYAAAAGLSVAVVEADKVGGTCLHRGCVPAKEFLEAAAVMRTVQGAGEFGISTPAPGIDFSVNQERKNSVVGQLYRGLVGLMRGRQIATFEGTGRLFAGNWVQVVDGKDAGTQLWGRHVVLAAGSAPRTLPGLKVDGRRVLTSDEFLDLEHVPSSVAVVGGGAIGCEFASLLVDLGARVTIVEALGSILPGCDEDVVSVVARSFKKRGVEIITDAQVHSHSDLDGQGGVLTLADGRQVDAEVVVVSVGRRPRTEGLVAEGTGVSFDDRGFVVADRLQRTSAENVFGVGDCVAGTPQLAHVAFAEDIVAVKTMLGEPAVPVDYDRVPWCIYCHPEVAFAGLTEGEARRRGLDVTTKKDPFGANSRARILGDTEGLVKVVAERGPDGSTGRILGVHMAGPWVTELLGSGYLAVNWEATPEEVAHFIQPHPSLSEAFGETVLALTGRGLHVG